MGVERSATLQLQSLQSERLRGVPVLVVGSHAVRQEVVAAHLRRWVTWPLLCLGGSLLAYIHRGESVAACSFARISSTCPLLSYPLLFA